MTGVSWCAAGCTTVKTVAKCSLFMDGIAIYGSLFLKLWHPLKRANPANTAADLLKGSNLSQRKSTLNPHHLYSVTL